MLLAVLDQGYHVLVQMLVGHVQVLVLTLLLGAVLVVRLPVHGPAVRDCTKRTSIVQCDPFLSPYNLSGIVVYMFHRMSAVPQWIRSSTRVHTGDTFPLEHRNCRAMGQ